MEKKNNKKLFILAGTLLLLVGVIGITFAYFSTGGAQEQANTFSSGCLNIELTNESASITLNNVYPITDIEGLEGTSYDFTIKNNCSTSTNYQINLESLNQASNSLSADYIKVSLSSDTVGNVISILGDNTSVTPEVANAYKSYNLYTASIGANEEKTYHLKIWLDYDATVEVAANKVYQSKINVIANPETSVTDTLEATFELNDKTLTANLTNNVTSATYCTTTSNICTPSTSASISNNSYTVELEENENKQMVCTRLNGISKVICSDSLAIAKTTLVENIESLYQDNQDMLAYDDYDNLRYIGANPNNYVLFNDELWRIIGVFSEDSHGVSGEKLVKIIRSESLGSMVWDSASTTDWSTASLQTTLNGDYLNGTGSYTSTGIKSEEAKEMIETVTWKLGGTASYTTAIASHWYGYERGTTVYSGRPITWSGKVGLMYPSDYGYATSGGSTTNRESCLAKELNNWNSSSFSDCKNNDWLFNGAIQWTLTPSSSRSTDVFRVSNAGYVNYITARNSIGVRPSIYLTSNVVISGGDGTSDSPYTLEA